MKCVQTTRVGNPIVRVSDEEAVRLVAGGIGYYVPKQAYKRQAGKEPSGGIFKNFRMFIKKKKKQPAPPSSRPNRQI